MWNSDNLGLTPFLGNLKVVLLNSVSSDEKTSKFIIKGARRAISLIRKYIRQSLI